MSEAIASAIQAWKQGDKHAAEVECRKVLKVQPWNPQALNLLGSIAGSVGKFESSADILRKAVAAAPRVIHFRENLARSLLQLDKSDEAEIVLREIDMESQPAGLQSLWAAVLGQNGKLDQALVFAQKAVDAAPDQPAFRYNLAELQRRSGDRTNALANLQETVESSPDHVDSLNNLAGLQLAEGEFLDALRSLEKLLQIAPKSAQAYFNLGRLLTAFGDPEAAVTAYRNARTLNKESERILFQLANAVAQTGRLDEAEKLVEELRSQNENSVFAKLLHARVLERQGEVDAASDIMATVAEEELKRPVAASVVALLQEQKREYEAAAETLNAVLNANEAEASDWTAIHFGLGDLNDKLGRYDEAFEHYQLANENRRKAFLAAREPENRVQVSDRLRELYDVSSYHDKPNSGLETKCPIFILGMPRSGTSLTEQILACHPQVYGGGELRAFYEAVSSTHERPDEHSSTPFKIIAEDPAAGRRFVPEGWDDITSQDLAEIGGSYLASLRKLDANLNIDDPSQRVTDKMPFNFFSAALIHKVFPQARIIHCTRDALDTCLSCYFQNFMSGNQYSFDLAKVGEFYREYEAIMNHWRSLDIPMLDVSYEGLVSDPEQSLRELLDYCGLPWDSKCLEFHKSKRHVATASYQQVREPIYTTSVQRWKHYEKHLTPLKGALGIQ